MKKWIFLSQLVSGIFLIKVSVMLYGSFYRNSESIPSAASLGLILNTILVISLMIGIWGIGAILDKHSRTIWVCIGTFIGSIIGVLFSPSELFGLYILSNASTTVVTIAFYVVVLTCPIVGFYASRARELRAES
jgi:hypothetical protein